MLEQYYYYILAATAAISFSLGWYIRRHTGQSRTIVVPPPSGSKAPYEVRLDGRVLYTGWDLHQAKALYKSDEYPRGILELYGYGNHIASRKA